MFVIMRNTNKMGKTEYVEKIRAALEARGVYDESLDITIGKLAMLYEQFDEASAVVGDEMVITQKSREGDERQLLNPAAPFLSTLAELIRKYNRDLGLMVAKPAGFIAQEKDTRPRSGDNLMSIMERIEQPKVRKYKRA